jgi:outer membrane receptor protein involved in Fe transport
MSLAPCLLLLLPPLQDDAGSLPEETIVVAPKSERTLTDSESLVVSVEAEDLERTGERSLPRAIERASGIFLQETNLGGGAPILRGLSGNQVLIVVDGVRMNDSTTRSGVNQSLSSIDPATVERVEILRGPASVLYGSDALGGAILVWTRGRAPARGDAEARGLGGGAGAEYASTVDGGRARLEGSFAADSLGALLIESGFDFDDLRSGDGTIENSGYHGNAVFGSFEQLLGEGWSLRSTASVHRELDVPRTDRVNPGFGQTEPSDQRNEFSLQDRQRYLLALTHRRSTPLWDRAQMRLSYRRYEEVRKIQGFGSSDLRDEQDVTDTVGVGADFKKALGSQLVTYGFELDHDEVDSSRFDTDLTSGSVTEQDGAFAPHAEYTSGGVFAQDEIPLGFVDLTAGLRFSAARYSFDPFVSSGDSGAIEDGFSQLTGSLQLARTIAEGVRLTGTLAQGFRAPGLSDVARNATVFGGTELANPDLDPETSLSADLAVDIARSRWQCGGSIFWSEIDDALGSRLIDAGDPGTIGDETYLRDNVGAIEIYGADASLRRELGASGSSWWGALSAAWTRGRQFDDTVDPMTGEKPFDDVPARRIPPLFGRVALEFAPAAPCFHIGWGTLEVLWAAEQDELNPQDEADPRIDPDGTPGYAVWNLDVGGPLGAPTSRASWNAGVHNIFDESYRVHGSGLDGPGLGFVVGLSWSR